MAGRIGQFGLAAALVSLLGMAVPFTYSTFVIGHAPWDVAYLGDYLHFLIQAITILVRMQSLGSRPPAPARSSEQTGNRSASMHTVSNASLIVFG